MGMQLARQQGKQGLNTCSKTGALFNIYVVAAAHLSQRMLLRRYNQYHPQESSFEQNSGADCSLQSSMHPEYPILTRRANIEIFRAFMSSSGLR